MKKFIKGLILVSLSVGVSGSASSINTNASSKIKSIPANMRGHWYAYNKRYHKYQEIVMSSKKAKFDIGTGSQMAMWHMNSIPFTTNFKLTKAHNLGTKWSGYTVVGTKINHGWYYLGSAKTGESELKITTMKIAGKKQKVLLEHINISGSNNVNKALVYTKGKHSKQYVIKTVVAD